MFFWFVGAMLATWRLTHLLVHERGPFGFMSRVRQAALRAVGGKVLTCFDCTSLWVAIPFVFVVSRRLPGAAVVWLALSGGAILLERWTRDPFQDSLSGEEGPLS